MTTGLTKIDEGTATGILSETGITVPLVVGSTTGTLGVVELAAYDGSAWHVVGSDASGNLKVSNAAGTAIMGKVGIDQTTPGTTNLVALTGETTKVIGVTRTADGSGNLITATSNALDINIKSGNLTTLPVTNAGTFAVQATLSTGGAIRAEDSASADADVGIGALAIRKASPGNTSSTDGDYEYLQMSAGRLWASATIDSALPAGTAVIGHVITDASSVTAATLSAETTKVIGVVRNSDGAGNLLTTNSTTYTAKFALDGNLLGTLGTAFSTAGKVDVKGADGDVFVRQATAANLNATVVQATGSNLHTVLDSGTLTTLTTLTGTTTLTPGTGAANLGKAEDAVHASGDTGVFTLCVGNEAQTTLAADGDYIGHAVDTKGNTLVVGNIASGTTDAGAPIKVGGIARTTPPTAVSSTQRVGAQFDIYGKQIVRTALREDLGNQLTTITSSTAETTFVTADATYKLDLYGVIISNTSATATKVTIKDSTAGTSRFIYQVPAGDVRGFLVDPSGAHKQAAANNNWTATCGTSIADLNITALTVRSL